MSKKNLVVDDTMIATLIETEEMWATISGEAAEKDFLHVVELFSAWCGPSDAITSTYKRLVMDFNKRKVKFFKMDTKLVPEFEEISKTSKPHFALFLNGEQVEMIEGVNAPLLEKLVADQIPEGVLETGDAGDGDEEDED